MDNVKISYSFSGFLTVVSNQNLEDDEFPVNNHPHRKESLPHRKGWGGCFKCSQTFEYCFFFISDVPRLDVVDAKLKLDKLESPGVFFLMSVLWGGQPTSE